MHKKRSQMSSEIPLPRKGTKYISKASHFSNKKMPLIFILRDIMGVAKTKHEARKICLEGNVKVNGKIRKDIKFPIGSRDIVTIMNKIYKVELEKKRYILKEVKEENKRILKVIGKRILKGKKIQANLEDGTNILTNEKFNVGDSFAVSIPENKIIKIIPLKEGSKVEIISGKYTGSSGKVIKVDEKNKFRIKLNEGAEVFIAKENLLAIE
ncbi:MAG: S4 domain-containing protein [Candidatus Pacearchaeota archaeon]